MQSPVIDYLTKVIIVQSTIIRAVCGFGGMPQKAEPDIIQLKLPQNVVTAYLRVCTKDELGH